VSADPLADTVESPETWPQTLRALDKRAKRIEEYAARIVKEVAMSRAEARAERLEYRLVSGVTLLMAASALAISCLR
jgi:hypothetical protein